MINPLMCPRCKNQTWSEPDRDDVRACTNCGHRMWFSPEWWNDYHEALNEDTQPIKRNTDNTNCVWCGKETKPLFNTDRYCPACEGTEKEREEAEKKKGKKLPGLDWDLLMLNVQYDDSPCQLCGEHGCSGLFCTD